MRYQLLLGLALLALSSPAFCQAPTAATNSAEPADYLRRVAPMRSLGSYIVMLPPDYETTRDDYPLVLILHGSGSSELVHGVLADRYGREGVVYAAVRAPYPDFGVTLSVGRAGYTAWPPETGVHESLLVTDYVTWILEVATAVEAEFRTRKGKVYIYGHSQGGQFASLVALRHPERVASYLSRAGSPVPTDEITPERLAQMKSQGVSVWLVHGLQDESVPSSVSDDLARQLSAAGIPVSLHLVAGGHTSNPATIELGRKWLNEVVLGRR